MDNRRKRRKLRLMLLNRTSEPLYVQSRYADEKLLRRQLQGSLAQRSKNFPQTP